jgi:hypothetical protein
MSRTYISVHVDIDEILEDISIKDLTSHLEDEGYVVTKKGAPPPLPPADVLAEMKQALRERRYVDAEVLLDRAMSPKWKNEGACEADYRRALGLSALQ